MIKMVTLLKADVELSLYFSPLGHYCTSAGFFKRLWLSFDDLLVLVRTDGILWDEFRTIRIHIVQLCKLP